jgi:hypothetical protein
MRKSFILSSEFCLLYSFFLLRSAAVSGASPFILKENIGSFFSRHLQPVAAKTLLPLRTSMYEYDLGKSVICIASIAVYHPNTPTNKIIQSRKKIHGKFKCDI